VDVDDTMYVVACLDYWFYQSLLSVETNVCYIIRYTRDGEVEVGAHAKQMFFFF
jgi:hypothetical protein